MKLLKLNSRITSKSVFISCLLLAIILGFAGSSLPKSISQKKPNILFIAIDDMNDWVGVLDGSIKANTPNIDMLASRGMLFTNAHTAAPECNPSRVAILTGLRPTSTGIYKNHQPWRPVLRNVVTIPEYFQSYGYKTLGAGKIFHGAYPDAKAWDDYFPSKTKTKPDDPIPAHAQYIDIQSTPNFKWGPVLAEDGLMGDVQVADWVIEQLGRKQKKPFFLAAGIFKPHLPWHVPQQYFDSNPLNEIKLPPVLMSDLEDIPPPGVALANRHGDHDSIVKYGHWEKAVQGYLASIEFADAQVGRIIDALDTSEFRDNTIIILWSDHGWHLGEKLHWRKFALWEESTRVPFIIVAPNFKPGTSSRPVNLIDIYPTLIELAGLRQKKGLDGQSLLPLLESPETDWPFASITTLDKGNHSVRNHRWRYIRYGDGSEELYDHDVDENEWNNLANDSQYAKILKDLSKLLPKNVAPPAPSDVFAQKDKALFGRWYLIEKQNDSVVAFGHDSLIYFIEFDSLGVKYRLKANPCQGNWTCENEKFVHISVGCKLMCCEDSFSQSLNYSGKYYIKDGSDLVIENSSGKYRLKKLE